MTVPIFDALTVSVNVSPDMILIQSTGDSRSLRAPLPGVFLNAGRLAQRAAEIHRRQLIGDEVT